MFLSLKVRRGLICLAAVALGIMLPTPVLAAEHFVSPDGLPGSSGTRAAPWNLATALAQPTSVRPGDIIWLRGGLYRGGFTSRLQGASGVPVVVRQYPGERATIDCQPTSGHDSALFEVMGSWVEFRDFEVTCTQLKRVTKIPGSWPDDMARGGIDCHGSHVRFINLVVHDTNEGFGFWTEGEGGEIYGCLIYHNGWEAPDRGHGHGIYTQNHFGTKRLVDNIIFEQYGYGIHAYGSPRAFIDGFHIEGNATFNNGAPVSVDHLNPDLFVGGETPARRIEVVSNYIYGFNNGAALLGYPWGPANDDAVFRNNVVAGGTIFLNWRRLDVSVNRFVNNGPLISIDRRKTGGQAHITAERNNYFGSGGFRLDDSDHDWASWKAISSLDASSQARPGRPRDVWTFIRPNQYEQGRANIVVYNWSHRPRVGVDLSAVLHAGQRYRIVWAQDFFGQPLVSGVYHGSPVMIPMAPRAAPGPIGLPRYQAPSTLPEFGVFVVLPDVTAPRVPPYNATSKTHH